jgi:hypothetical protein
MEIVMDIQPLPLYIKGEIMKAMLRLQEKVPQDWSGQRKGMLQLGHVR